MLDTPIQILTRLASSLAGVFAVIAVARGATDSHIVAVASISALIFVVGRSTLSRFSSIAFPLLGFADLLLFDEATRLLASGIVLAAAVALFMIDEFTGADEPRALPTFMVVASLVALLRFLPTTAGTPGEAIVAVGCLILLLTFRWIDRFSVLSVAIVLIVATFAVATPVRASFYPMLLAAVVASIRVRRWWYAVALSVAAFLIGKWALPIVALVVVRTFLRRGDSSIALPVLGGVQLLTFAPMIPTVVASSFRVPRVEAGTSLLLIAFAAFAPRPYLGAIYLIAAVVFLIAAEATPRRFDFALMAIVLVLLAMSAWSGIASSTLALPVVLPCLLLLTGITAVVALPRIPGVVAALFVVCAAAAALLVPRFERSDGAEAFPAVAAAESVVVTLESSPRHVAVTISAANAGALEGSSAIGFVEWVDQVNRGYRRQLLLREVADWGSFRQESLFSSNNSLPRVPAGTFVGRGRQAYLRGSGDIAISAESGIRYVRVTADKNLPAPAQLIVERIAPR